MKGFRKFLLRGNVVDLAVGVVIGAAFTAVVSGFVKDFLTPLIGLFGGANNDLGKKTWHSFAYGDFINVALSFLITAAVVYFFVVLPISKLTARFATKADVDAPKKDCPECLSSIPAAASRCAFCTAPVPVEFATTVPRQ
ncbi:large conductance mechanosensitive channel protein MscL [Streptacidiphilus jiangxiensis]|uniref:Large conductance mechanosensitive channel n=1 Tax=Streptacidiphilus jiangxiensis TaxID=235985 RepID=A0A1H7J158_STRJI|nr:large conductance mechanosensitive channel protein MscL [Streptacidiphilus jiangxiensis]SEK67680.1 large conductance mechanosensitive channel [Streptacidiphilus jiangxiensis]